MDGDKLPFASSLSHFSGGYMGSITSLIAFMSDKVNAINCFEFFGRFAAIRMVYASFSPCS
jgi:hypothetical protein